MLSNGVDYPKNGGPNTPRLDIVETEQEFIARFVEHPAYTAPLLYKYDSSGNVLETIWNGEFLFEAIVQRVAQHWEKEITPAVRSYGVDHREFIFYIDADCGGYDVEQKVCVKLIGGDGII